MRLLIILLITLPGWADILTINVPAPAYRISGNKITFDGASYINTPGTPDVPKRPVTIALPPGAIVEGVNFRGVRHEIGIFKIPPAIPPLPMSNEKMISNIWERYKRYKDMSYSSNKIYPQTYGSLQSRGGLRKYTLITVTCHHFAYNPVTRKLYYSPNITVEINYRMPDPGSKRAEFWRGLKDDVTFDDYAQELIYNWHDAQAWYHTDNPRKANGYTIILPTSLQNTVDSLVTYRQSQGFDVKVVTTEYIDSTVTGVDLTQKIRNYLRANLPDIEYALFVGYITYMPMRYLVPINNDPNSWFIPSDLYFAELTDPDSISWNSDHDQYYGEVFTDSLIPPGDDNPDYHPDIHVGRIPISSTSSIEYICKRIIEFDSNTDQSFKTSALLAASIPFYKNQNHTGYPRIDGSDDAEALMDDSIINRGNTDYFYEKAGLRPSPHPCTDSLCKMNMIGYWNKKGIVYEYHHGEPQSYARFVWAWDDGDSIPEDNELKYIGCLDIGDVYKINNAYSATTILRSCNCGHPDQYSLSMALLERGASIAIIAGTRGVWVLLGDRGGLPHHFLNRLMKDTTSSNGIIGDAFDLAKIDFMDSTGWWFNAYVLNFFGDPATKQLGRQIKVGEEPRKTPLSSFSVYPNPSSHLVTIYFQSTKERNITLDIYDESGRRVQRLYNGRMNGAKRLTIKLPTGIYFLKYSDPETTGFKKIVILR